MYIFFLLLVLYYCSSSCLSNCTSGEYLCDNECITCSPGFYCDAIDESPKACDAGDYNPKIGSYVDTDCIQCEPGTYSSSTGQMSCTPCEVGNECGNGGDGSNKKPCDDGYYADHVGMVDCIECPANHICETTKKDLPPEPCLEGEWSAAGEYTICSSCASGSYSLTKGSSCITCPKGSECSGGSSITECPAGEYQENTGQASCDLCPSGTFTIHSGSESCMDCPPGYYCENADDVPQICPKGEVSAGGQVSSCSTCVDGEYTRGPGGTTCLDCPPGTYCNVGTDNELLFPYSCPIGTYSAARSTSINDCLDCDSGHYCPDPSLAPIDCPAGTFASSSTEREYCDPVTNGNYQDSTEGSSETPCPAGKYCPDPQQTPIDCPAGTYSSGLARWCTPCPLGKTSSGASSICDDCPSGQYCPDPAGVPIDCPDGYISAGGTIVECTVCTSGTVANVDACDACPAGSQCSDPIIGSVACDPGYYVVTPDYCTECLAGSYCDGINIDGCGADEYSLPGASSCKPCEVGMDCVDPANPKPCGDDEYSEYGVAACSTCPAGMQCSGGDVTSCGHGHYSGDGDNECKICSPGSYCDDPTGGETPCPSAQGSVEYSVAGQRACTYCPAGFYCPFTEYMPIQCPEGQRSQGGRSSCIACTEGKYCLDETSGFGGEDDCVAGEFTTSDGGFFECLKCPPGYTCPLDSYTTVVCAVGFYSTGSMDCVYCGEGYYCPTPHEAPRKCPYGFYTDGGTGYEECSMCTAGSYCDNPVTGPQDCLDGEWSPEGSGECFECVEGYRCPAQSDISDLLQCQDGYYCPTGTTNVALGGPIGCPGGMYGFGPARGPSGQIEGSCALCSPGSYCDGPGAAAETTCTAGNFCPAGSDLPTPCPAGTYRLGTGAKSVADCDTCDEGEYCLEGVTGGLTCPAGFYCPIGTTQSDQYPCPEGTYSAATGNTHYTDCADCTDGHYCPEACTLPMACPVGTYNPNTGAGHVTQCLLCEPGYACEVDGLTTYTGTDCEAGYYCPRGTRDKTDFPCPSGTWSSKTDLHRVEDCEICPRGYYCPEATTDYSVNDCPAGYYCPGAAGVRYFGEFEDHFTEYDYDFPCHPGTYSNTENLWDADDCTVCDTGKYCLGGNTTTSGDCDAGYYCPAGTRYSNEFPCPSGTYTTSTSCDSEGCCTDCELGYYCPRGSMDHIMCENGTFSNTTNMKRPGPTYGADPYACLMCTAGFYCLEGTGIPPGCPEGTYSSEGQSDCQVCLRGFYCPGNTSRENMLETYICDAGYYCDFGTGTPTETDNACPKSYYCPAGTEFPVPCPKGTFNNLTGLNASEFCQICPAGSYCLKETSEPSGECDVGYYCPAGSDGPTQEPCPPRTFRNTTEARSSDDCYSCPEGYYCPIGSVEPIICPNGYYCPPGSFEATFCVKGTYGNGTGLTAAEFCVHCPSGEYCNGLGILEPTGYCDRGYFCIGRATTSKPTDEVTGDLCPRGGFCDAGSSFPTACNPGTYNNFTGGQTIDDCLPCMAGYYCSGSSNVLPTAQCWGGYYCEGGSAVPTQYLTPKGYYTQVGSSAPVPCPKGTMGNDTGLTSCIECEAGYYCSETGMEDFEICPAGNYCPQGSTYPIRCPVGTFSNETRNSDVSHCNNCTGGKYCFSTGMIEPSGDCSPGYFCRNGSIEYKPIEKGYGDLCPEGHYCPSGTYDPIPCHPGTFQSSYARSSVVDCLPCLPGYYCPEYGHMNSTSYVCNAGYYCDSGAENGTQHKCSKGHFCVEGSANEVPCSEGYFANETGFSSCLLCTEGYYCPPATVDPIECPKGSYCPSGTGNFQPKCPAGTFRNLTTGVSPDDCFLCRGGKYCSVDGLPDPNGNCFPGYYCVKGAKDDIGTVISGGESGVCPKGNYCPEGSKYPTPCGTGTFLDTEGGFEEEQCLDCTPGYYCNDTGLEDPVGMCDVGYYCPGGASSPQEIICPEGSYCIYGSIIPEYCPKGQFQNMTGYGVCWPCPEGYYCPINTSDPIICPIGYYCPTSTEEITLETGCPIGTYGNITGLKSASDCLDCDGGKYCNVKGLKDVAGDCAAGHYCTPGSIDNMGRKNPGDPPSLCTVGHYCPIGTNDPIDCPEGTYSPTTGNVNETSCVLCTPGEYCGIPGSSSTTGLCYKGYYCVLGAKTDEPTDGVTGDICTAGHFCPNGTISPFPCSEGTYASTTGFDECDPCLEGNYCLMETVTPTPCREGSYCPEGTGRTLPYCPPGSYNNGTGLAQESECLLCDGGWSCNVYGLVTPDVLCTEGYYCPSGALNPYGVIGILGGVAGGVCPTGKYCPTGTATPVGCPSGTYNPEKGLTNYTECKYCDPGYYCGSTGQSAVTDLCFGGYYCPSGQSVPNPVAFECPVGHYCVNGSIEPSNCVDGYYQDETGKISCKICPAGFFCRVNCSTPADCPVGFYCNEGTDYPTKCPNGTFGNDTNYEIEVNCYDCLQAKFCLSGQVSGDCYAGYECLEKSHDPSPINMVPYGDVCPIGYYCPIGTIDPTPCPNGTAGTDYGGRDDNICGPCPKGKECTFVGGDPTPLPCPKGKYCPLNTPPIHCDIGTYNPVEGGGNESACLPCKAGYLCPSIGIIEPSIECPVGTFCPPGSLEPIDCPIGTFNNETAGTSISESCLECPAGYFCNGSVNPIACQLGEYCLPGSIKPRECPPKKYCPDSSAPTDCPGGYYCPAGTYNPLLCTSGYYYCPYGMDRAIPCPLGYYAKNGTNLRITLEETCSPCPGGTYGLEDRTACENCDVGYVCLPGSTSPRPIDVETENGYICPKGYYCPEGCAKENACEKGEFQKDEGKGECDLCPESHYSDEKASSYCKVCGSNSDSIDSRITCECKGSSRSFQKSDGSCLCYPGYVHYEENTIQDNKDSQVDCQEIVYSRCGGDELRSPITGECTKSTYCVNTCSLGNRTIHGTLGSTGICECQETVDHNSICDMKCRREQLQLWLVPETEELILYDPVLKQDLFTISANDVLGWYFPDLDCMGESQCLINAIQTNSDGFKGLYNVAFDYFMTVLNQTGKASVSGRRAVDSQEIGANGVYQPLVCLNYGEMLLFHVTDRTHYPVYMKDSLLNTNPDFDYGAFRKLENYLKSDLEIDTFLFSFKDTDSPGVYVFYDADNEDKVTIVKVMEKQNLCPGKSTYAAASTSNVVLLGINENESIRLTPDWVLVGCLFASFIAFFFVFICGGKYLYSSDWTNKKEASGKFRKTMDPEKIKKEGLSSWEMEELYRMKSKEERDENLVDLSEFDILGFRKLLAVTRVQWEDDVERFKDTFFLTYNDIMEETALIKDIMKSKYGIKDYGIEVEDYKKKIDRYKEVIKNDSYDYNEEILEKIIGEYQNNIKKFKDIPEGEDNEKDSPKEKRNKNLIKQNKFLGAMECSDNIEKLKKLQFLFQKADEEGDVDRIRELNRQLIALVSRSQIPKYWSHLRDSLNKSDAMNEQQSDSNKLRLSSNVTDLLKDLLNETLDKLKYKYRLAGVSDEDDHDDLFDDYLDENMDDDDSILRDEELDEILELDYGGDDEEKDYQKLLIQQKKKKEGGGGGGGDDDDDDDFAITDDEDDDDEEEEEEDEGEDDDETRGKRSGRKRKKSGKYVTPEVTLIKQLKKTTKDLKLEHVSEIVDLEKQMDDEFDEGVKQIDESINKVKEMVLKSKKKKVKDQIEFSFNLSEEERNSLLDESRKELEHFEVLMDQERNRQILNLRKMMERKMAAKKQALLNKHQKDIDLKTDLSEKERNELKEFLELEKRESDGDELISRKDRENMTEEELKKEKKKKKKLQKYMKLLELRKEQREYRLNEENSTKRKNLEEFMDDLERIEHNVKVKQSVDEDDKKKKSSDPSSQCYTDYNKLLQLVKEHQQLELEGTDNTIDENAKNAILSSHQVELQKMEELIQNLKGEYDSEFEERLKRLREQKLTELKQNNNDREKKILEEKEKEMKKLRNLLSKGIEEGEESTRREVKEKIDEMDENLEFQQYLIEKERKEGAKKIEDEEEKLVSKVDKKITGKEAELKKQIDDHFNNEMMKIDKKRSKTSTEQTEREKQELMKQKKEQMIRLKDMMSSDKMNQMNEIEERIRRKKQRLEDEINDKKVFHKKKILEMEEEELKKIGSDRAKRSDGSRQKEMYKQLLQEDIKKQLDNVEVSDYEKEKEEEMKKKHQNELEELETNLKRKKEKELMFLRQVMENEYLNEERKLKNQIFSELDDEEEEEYDMRKKLSTSLMEQKNEALDSVNERKKRLEEMEQRQIQILQQKLQQKLKHKREEMKKKFEEEISNLKNEQEEKEEEVKRRRQFELEKKLIVEAIIKLKVKSVEEAIHLVLSPRHQKELEDMKIAQEHEFEIIDDEEDEEEAEKLNLKQQEDRVKLRKRQFVEIREIEKECEKYKYLFQDNLKEEEQVLKQELLDYEKQLEQEKQEIKTRMEDEKQKMKEKLQQQYESEKQKILEETEAVKKKLREEEGPNISQIARDQNNLSEKRKVQRLIEQHKTDIFNFEELLRQEKKRQDEILEQRINDIINERLKFTKEVAELKKGREKKKVSSLEGHPELALPKKKIDPKNQKDIKSTIQKIKKRREMQNKIKKSGNAEAFSKSFENLGKQIEEGMSNEDLNSNMLMGLKVKKKKKEKKEDELILTPEERMLKERLSILQQIYAKLRTIKSLSAKAGRAFVHPLSIPSPPNVRTVSPIPSSELQPIEIVVYEFGVFLIDYLVSDQNIVIPSSTKKKKKKKGKNTLKLAVTSTIPRNTHYEYNAFKHCFYYSKPERTLFIKREKLHQLGPLIVLLVHCVSHIGIDSMEDDRDTKFIEMFHRCWETVIDDVFERRLLRPQVPGKKINPQEVAKILNFESSSKEGSIVRKISSIGNYPNPVHQQDEKIGRRQRTRSSVRFNLEQSPSTGNRSKRSLSMLKKPTRGILKKHEEARKKKVEEEKKVRRRMSTQLTLPGQQGGGRPRGMSDLPRRITRRTRSRSTRMESSPNLVRRRGRTRGRNDSPEMRVRRRMSSGRRN